MTRGLAAVLMMNNYFHDVATAMVIATAGVSWIVIGKAEKTTSLDTRSFYLKIYSYVVTIFRYSLFWLMLGAIPRILTFKVYELREAEIKGLVLPLLVKLIIAFSLVIVGSLMWIKISKRVKLIKNT